MHKKPKQITPRFPSVLPGLLLVCLGASAGFCQPLDAPMPDDADFIVNARDLNAAKMGGRTPNPLAKFVSLANDHLPVGDPPDTPGTSSYFLNLKTGTLTIPPHVEAIDQAFRELSAPSNSKNWWWPEMGAGPASQWTTGSPVTIRRALQLLSPRAHAWIVTGEQDQAVEALTNLVQFSEQLQRQPCGLAHLAVSNAALRMGLSKLERALVPRHISALRLSQLQQRLTIRELNPADVQYALRVDYTQFKESLPQLADAEELSQYQFTRLLEPFAPLLLKPGSSCAMRLKDDRLIISSLDRSWKEGLETAVRLSGELTTNTNTLRQRRLSTNPLGEYHHLQHLNSISAQLDEFMQYIAIHRLTLLQLAIRRYELEHESLPERLEDLVPKYIAAVPAAPYANAPIAWNPRSEYLRAPGLNPTQEGGIGMLYWWGEPAAQRRLRAYGRSNFCPVGEN